MSNILVRNIVGSNTYDVPESGAELGAAGNGLDILISGVALLNFVGTKAMVEDTEGGARVLSYQMDGFDYNTSECPSEAVLDQISGLIRNALLADEDISSVGDISYDLFRG